MITKQVKKYQCQQCGLKKSKEAFGSRGDRFQVPMICNRCKNGNLPLHKHKYPEKYKAQKKARKALRKGLIILEPCCSICKEFNVKLEMHHPDYSKPLDIVWLCQQCHTKLHNLKIRANR